MCVCVCPDVYISVCACVLPPPPPPSYCKSFARRDVLLSILLTVIGSSPRKKDANRTRCTISGFFRSSINGCRAPTKNVSRLLRYTFMTLTSTMLSHSTDSRLRRSSDASTGGMGAGILGCLSFSASSLSFCACSSGVRVLRGMSMLVVPLGENEGGWGMGGWEGMGGGRGKGSVWGGGTASKGEKCC